MCDLEVPNRMTQYNVDDEGRPGTRGAEKGGRQGRRGDKQGEGDREGGGETGGERGGGGNTEEGRNTRGRGWNKGQILGSSAQMASHQV